MGMINNAAQAAAESIFFRFLRNAGIEDMVNNPKQYELTLSFVDDGTVVKIKKKKGGES